MRKSSAAAEAIICSFRSMSPISVEKPAGYNAAETWVQAAIAAGGDPLCGKSPF